MDGLELRFAKFLGQVLSLVHRSLGQTRANDKWAVLDLEL